MERWKPVVEFEGLYEVSDHGRVCVLPRYRFAAKVLKPYVNRERGSYRYVNLHKDGKQYMRRIARLVAAAFIGACPVGYVVCHNDGDNQNDCVSNLRYGSHFENMQDKRRHGTHPAGERHPQARLTRPDIALIRRSSLPTSAIAELFGVCQKHVNAIQAGVKWR
jgi:hypothetical protein